MENYFLERWFFLLLPYPATQIRLLHHSRFLYCKGLGTNHLILIIAQKDLDRKNDYPVSGVGSEFWIMNHCWNMDCRNHESLDFLFDFVDRKWVMNHGVNFKINHNHCTSEYFRTHEFQSSNDFHLTPDTLNSKIPKFGMKKVNS